MDSIRVSEAPDSGSIPDEATNLQFHFRFHAFYTFVQGSLTRLFILIFFQVPYMLCTHTFQIKGFLFHQYSLPF